MPSVLETQRTEKLRHNFSEGLTTYTESLARKRNIDVKRFDPRLLDNALDILTDHARISTRMQSDGFTEMLKHERMLKGDDVKEGFVICVDGRLIDILFAGKHVNVWEEPASLFQTTKGEAGEPIVASKVLKEAIEKTASVDREMFEIVFAHTSLTTSHVCGKADALSKQEGHPLFGLKGSDLAIKNLEMLESEQVPAITNTYNNARPEEKKLKQVAVSALFDTDTYGITLNFGKKESLSTSALLEGGLKEQIETQLGTISHFGKYKDNIDNSNFFRDMYKDLILVSEGIVNGVDGFAPVAEYISTHYPDLTPSQTKAFIFTMARTIAFQYITGLSTVPAEGPTHPFAHHAEEFATITTEGGQAIIGRYDMARQSFGVTASTKQEAQEQMRDVVLPLLDKNHKSIAGRHVVFVTAPCAQLGGQKNKVNATKEVRMLMEQLLNVPEVAERVDTGKLLLVPVLVEEYTGDIIEIPQLVD